MRQIPVRVLMLIALSVPLGACNSFLGINFARHASRSLPSQATAHDPATDVEAATAAGRRQLAEGQTGLAIESFRKALGNGEPIAPAVNGLGVAFARLGRFDLARRYFDQAIAADPANSKYADNLTRLMRSSALALRHDGDIGSDVLASAEPATRLVVVQSAVLGKLQRVSRGEVRITAVPLQPAPIQAASGRAGGSKVDAGFQPVVRISIADPAGLHRPSSVRIVLPDAKPAESATAPHPAKASRPH